jgi:hypothetical protein
MSVKCEPDGEVTMPAITSGDYILKKKFLQNAHHMKFSIVTVLK